MKNYALCTLFVGTLLTPTAIKPLVKQSPPPEAKPVAQFPAKKYSYEMSTVTIRQCGTEEVPQGAPMRVPQTSVASLEGYPITLLPKGMSQNPRVDGTTYVAIYTGLKDTGPVHKRYLEQDPSIGSIKNDYVILCLDCSEPIIYKNIKAVESSLTGTPGYLRDRQHYLGYAIIQQSTNLPGSGKRVDFFTE